jgi:hypothetical protein
VLAQLAEAGNFDVALVANTSSSPSASGSDADWDELCLEHGFEYVDTEAVEDDENGQGTSVSQLRLFWLKAHI